LRPVQAACSAENTRKSRVRVWHCIARFDVGMEAFVRMLLSMSSRGTFPNVSPHWLGAHLHARTHKHQHTEMRVTRDTDVQTERGPDARPEWMRSSLVRSRLRGRATWGAPPGGGGGGMSRRPAHKRRWCFVFFAVPHQHLIPAKGLSREDEAS
jgi:hypothetical protein